ncbi:MAG: oligosaccharide flippase family protein, partial [Spirochaetes bacterium]|nr:oligosaccharide flippase family protein [Spirochaetota bacterium]
MSESNLAKNTLIYAIGNIGVLIINFVLVPFYTFFLTKEELGYYDFIVTTAMFIAPFATLQVEMAILRWLLDNDSKNIKKSVITNSFFILSINLLLLTALFFAFSKYFIDKYNIIILFYYVLFFLYPLFKQILRGIGKPKQYIFVEICYTSLFLILSILFIVHFKLGVKGLLISNIIALSFSILFVFFNNKIYNYIGKQYFSKSLLIKMLKYSVPMILNISSVWFMTSAIKYFIIYFNRRNFKLILRKKGIVVNTSTKVTKIQKEGDKLAVFAEGKNGEIKVTADMVLMST